MTDRYTIINWFTILMAVIQLYFLIMSLMFTYDIHNYEAIIIG